MAQFVLQWADLVELGRLRFGPIKALLQCRLEPGPLEQKKEALRVPPEGPARISLEELAQAMAVGLDRAVRNSCHQSVSAANSC